CNLDYVMIEAKGLVLLQASRLNRHPKAIASAEVLHRVAVKYLVVVFRHIRVPGRYPSARNYNEARVIDPKFRYKPLQKGNPVKELKSDFREPWSDHDRTLAVCQFFKRPKKILVP